MDMTGLNPMQFEPVLMWGWEYFRFFGLITGGTTPASIVGDFLTTLYDLNVALHLPKETNAITIEQLALDMVLDLCQIPREAYPGKLLTTGATASNTMGMMIARQWVGKKRFNIDIAEDGFCGKVIKVIGGKAHSSVIKAVGVAGLGRGNYIDVSLDQRGYKWDLEKLETILKEQMNGDSEGSIVVVGCGEVLFCYMKYSPPNGIYQPHHFLICPRLIQVDPQQI